MATQEDDDLFTIVMYAMGSLGALMTAGAALALSTWRSSVEWLLEHKVIVPRSAEPWFELPRAAGAGLDGARVAIACAVLLVLLMVLVQSIKRYWAREQELQ